ncbi:D-alanine-D-alanine ligase [Gracilibacillus orientalis]|uniref:D-alanine-D-alanine ligase n=1 Tax=Gracilibacillus orientalis TaxID=334253 RepID=A0A1I4PH97_9BACI|nr:ATP-grasp domain-containing protein [Gracilibacillus orientalis]SFM27179.1 D-alanine-D-alanine ligase [Gracilibacillus orientalis]
MEQPQYLAHLESSIPEDAWGYTVSSYTVVLEAWRRGLKIKFINENRRKSELTYTISNGEKEHVFSVARGDLVPREAILTCKDKNKTKDVLLKHNVPTPVGKEFNSEATEGDYVKYGDELGYPLVVKPVDGTGGKGVITGIQNKEALLSSIDYLKTDLNVNNIIIERYVEGKDYRLYVLDGKVIGAFTRDRANVIGDGKSSIEQLVAKKNKLRGQNPALKGRSKILLNKEAKVLLEEKQYDFKSVPGKGEKVYLNTKNNVSSGGDPTDATDFFKDSIKQIAVDAAKAIPGLIQGGVDMIIDDNQEHGYVIEVNSRPHIRAHMFPMQGKARDIPKEVIDFYFPETKGQQVENKLFFDFDIIYKSFVEGVCGEFTLPTYPESEIILKRYELTGVSEKEQMSKFCSLRARRYQLNGYMKGIGASKSSLVLVGTSEDIQTLLKDVKAKYKNIQLSEKVRKSPVRIGFSTINMNRNTSKKSSTTSNKGKGSKASKKVVSDDIKVTKNPNDPNIDGYFPLKLTEGSKKSVSKKKTTNKKTSTSLNKNTTKATQKEARFKNRTSRTATKPLRVVSRMLKRK